MGSMGRGSRLRVKRIADEHFMVMNRMYHWGLNNSGKRESHSGLMKNCELKHSQKVKR